ncbi:MAG: type III-B CRISPR-associated protein Cas10/Cmr2 [Candidatus Latescibacteria bacterium]|nr:type III-B CRISPR-associated protein Cas10/Cmr2 [Candidatus Latescibacterota bacterium]
MTQDEQLFWKLKLFAYLHDPPDKCFNIYRHEENAVDYQANAGFTDPDERRYLSKLMKPADHYASAADRFVFPRRKCSTSYDGQEGSSYIHPLSSQPFTTPNDLKQRAESLSETLRDVVGAIDMDDWRTKFYLYWRRWLENAVTTKKEFAQYLSFSPADTRIPDHSIWNHMSATSAFVGCIENKSMNPALLLFQLGGVQEFIAQARSTRDLWSGSYLLSWLIAHALKAISDEVGPDAIIFPNLRNNGIFDMLHREILDGETFKHGDTAVMTLWECMLEEKGDYAPRLLLTPTLPNRFLALVPASKAEKLAKAAEEAIQKELQHIGDVVWTWIETTAAGTLDERDKERWYYQIEMFPVITWAVQPWLDAGACLEEFARLPVNQNGDDTPLQRLQNMLDLAEEWLPDDDRDSRYYTDKTKTKLNNPGILWSAHYALADAKLAARRNTRDFHAWNDPFYGLDADVHERELLVKDSLSGKEEVIGDKKFWEILHKLENGRLFPGRHRYGTMNLIKRLWCRSEVKYLLDKTGLEKSSYEQALGFDSVCDVACKNSGNSKGRNDEGELIPVNSYVALIAMDGDEMGKWVSGEKTPVFLKQLSHKAREYLEPIITGITEKELRRLLTPSYHMQFSEALSNFSTWLAAPVVKKFDGQLIYSGGDDVLAMVPAEKAIECAAALRAAFRGEGFETIQDILPVEESRPGFVQSMAGYPLVVPGPSADVSVGIAMGHCKVPLQMMVKEAKRAEKTAKKTYGRSALTVFLYKRSGEIIEWGCKWDDTESGRVEQELLRRVTELSRGDDAHLSGRFPYALAELLKPYDLEKVTDTGRERMKAIIMKEFDHVLDRQGKTLNVDQKKDLRKLSETWLKQTENKLDDFVKLFLVETFMNRQGGDD